MNYRGGCIGLLAAALLSACTARAPVAPAPSPAPVPAAPSAPVAAAAPAVPVAPAVAPAAEPVAAIEEQPTPAAKPVGGIALGPSLALVQNVTPGAPLALDERGLRYHGENRGRDPLPVTLAILPPATAGTAVWELGYEPLPEPGWITIDPGTALLGGEESRDFAVRVAVPADPKWANRRFVACVTLRPDAAAGVGAGLALAARLLVETSPSPLASEGAATVPSLVELDLARGAAGEASVLVRRPADGAALAWRRLADIEPTAVRRDRYRTSGTAEAPAGMVAPAFADGAAAGTWQALRLAVHAPDRDDAEAYEELLVVGTPAELELAADQRRERQPRVALVRCIVHRTQATGR